jgi:hypothetical protein
VPGHPSLSLLGHGMVEDHHGLFGEMQQAPLGISGPFQFFLRLFRPILTRVLLDAAGTGCHVNWHSDGAFHRHDQLPSRLLQVWKIDPFFKANFRPLFGSGFFFGAVLLRSHAAAARGGDACVGPRRWR